MDVDVTTEGTTTANSASTDRVTSVKTMTFMQDDDRWKTYSGGIIGIVIGIIHGLVLGMILHFIPTRNSVTQTKKLSSKSTRYMKLSAFYNK